MLLLSQAGNALGSLSIIIMKPLLVCEFIDEMFESQISTNATSYRCWLTTNPHLQALLPKAKICIWDWCDFCCQKVQLRVPTKTAAKSKLSESAWTLTTRTKQDCVCARHCTILTTDQGHSHAQQFELALHSWPVLEKRQGKQSDAARKPKWC